MQHGILYKRPGYYSLGPVPQLLPDGRLTVGVVSSPFADHYGLADWIVFVSDDKGETFTETNDQTIPLAWPAALPRESYDRYAEIQPDGSYLAAGTVGFEVWPKERAAEAEEQGLTARPHPDQSEDLLIGMPKLFVMRSHDQGQTWDRRDWLMPGFSWMTAFPRWTRLQSGHILLPVYARDLQGDNDQVFLWRSDPNGDNWRLIPLCSSVSSVTGDETCFIEAEPGKVLCPHPPFNPRPVRQRIPARKLVGGRRPYLVPADAHRHQRLPAPSPASAGRSPALRRHLPLAANGHPPRSQ